MTQHAEVKQIIRRSTFLFAGQVTMAGILAVNNLLLARILGPVGKGEVATLVLIPTALSVLLGVGLPTGIPYQVSRGRLSARTSAGLGTVWAANLTGVGAFLWLIMTLGGFWDRFPVSNSHLVALSLATLPFLLLGQVLEGTLIALARERTVAGLRVGQASSYLVLAFLLGGLAGLGVWGVYSAFFLASIGSSGLAWWICRRNAQAPDAQLGLVDVMRESKGLYFNAIADFLLYRLDWILLSALMPMSELGVYSVAVPFSETLWFLTAAVRPVLFAALSSGRVGDRKKVTLPVLLTTMCVAAVVGVLVYFVAIAAIHHFLPKFDGIAPILPILLLACGVALIFQFLQADLNSRGLGSASAALGMTTALIGVGVYAYFVPRWGTIGAAWSSFIVYAINSLITVVVYFRVQRRSYSVETSS